MDVLAINIYLFRNAHRATIGARARHSSWLVNFTSRDIERRIFRTTIEHVELWFTEPWEWFGSIGHRWWGVEIHSFFSLLLLFWGWTDIHYVFFNGVPFLLDVHHGPRDDNKHDRVKNETSDGWATSWTRHPITENTTRKSVCFWVRYHEEYESGHHRNQKFLLSLRTPASTSTILKDTHVIFNVP